MYDLVSWFLVQFSKNHFLLLLLGVSSTFIQAQELIEYQDSVGINHVYYHDGFIGGGVAIFDYDNDGDEDIYLTSGMRPDHFYVNDGTGKFTNQAVEMGFGITSQYNTMGVITGDIDNDGFKDVFVTTKQRIGIGYARNLLFRNLGDGTFEEIWANTTHEGIWSVSATFLDYNLDGFLDIYIGNYVDKANIIYDADGQFQRYAHECFGNQLYKNLGNGQFENVTSFVQLFDRGCTLAVAASDYDLDGDVDIFSANDFGPYIEANRLYNNRIETFRNASTDANAGQPIFGMGIAAGDYDNDLDVDYYITNLGSNLLLNNENGQFLDVAAAANIQDEINLNDPEKLATGWGCGFFDIDNDTDLDLYIANGFVPFNGITLINDADRLYMNDGKGKFEIADFHPTVNNNFVSRGFATGDLDNDGDLDMVVVVQKAPLNSTAPRTKIYFNQTETQRNWLRIQLVGRNSNGIGAKIYVYAGGHIYLREIGGGSSFGSHSSTIAHFGLDDISYVDSVNVLWSGRNDYQTLAGIDVNQTISIEQEEELVTSINPSNFVGKLVLSPNPASKTLLIQHHTLAAKTCKMYNSLGELQLTQALLAEETLIDISSLPTGLYFVQFDDDPIFQKFIKMP